MALKKSCNLYAKFGLILKGAQVQQALARSLVGDCKIPCYFDFDQTFTPELLKESIYLLESVGIKVLIFVCDQGTVDFLTYFEIALLNLSLSPATPCQCFLEKC